jgi:hypothetical protein
MGDLRLHMHDEAGLEEQLDNACASYLECKGEMISHLRSWTVSQPQHGNPSQNSTSS